MASTDARLARQSSRVCGGREVVAQDSPVSSSTEYIGKPHGNGVVERVLVHEGTITVGSAGDPLTLGPGDFARYGADRSHVYRSVDEDCHGVLLVGYPPS